MGYRGVQNHFRSMDKSAAVLGCLLAFFSAGAAMSQDRPNILLCSIEDLGMHIGAVGTPAVATPNFDKLVDQGLVFSKAFVAGPTCSVSKASLYTGHYPHSNNLRTNVWNSHGPVTRLTGSAKNFNDNNAILDSIPTLIELLVKGGYRTALGGKFHIYPNQKFPYSDWNPNEPEFMKKTDKPWFLVTKASGTHRPFRSGKGPEPDRSKLEFPGHLPDMPEVREDWAKYLRMVQSADASIPAVLDRLEKSGQKDNTILIITSDHGPAYHARGKYTPYNLGMNVPLIVLGPEKWVKKRGGGILTNLINQLDLMPTILDYAGLPIPKEVQGISLRGLFENRSDFEGNKYIFGEVSHRTNDMHNRPTVESRSVFDGRYRLVFHDNRNLKWFQPADNTNVKSWDNYVYPAIMANKAKFPKEFGLLAQWDSNYPETPPEFELYDLQNDKWEVNNIFGKPEVAGVQHTLIKALKDWAIRTHDTKYIDINKLKYDPAMASLAPGIRKKAPAIHVNGSNIVVNFQGNYRLEIRNVKNELVKKAHGVTGISTQSFSPGMYFLTVHSAVGVFSEKVVVF